MRILVVEDDLEAQRYLVQGLKESGHVVDDAADGDVGLSLALSRPYDVAIIDRMLPKMDGLGVVAEMREHGNSTPVLFLSALSEVDDRVKGLKAGGDDYLTKPYAFVELLARIEALMRRRSPVGVKPGWKWAIWNWIFSPAPPSAAARASSCSRGNSVCWNI